MHCYWCHVESGALTLKEHEAARWLNMNELYSVNWLPADLELLDVLKSYHDSYEATQFRRAIGV